MYPRVRGQHSLPFVIYIFVTIVQSCTGKYHDFVAISFENLEAGVQSYRPLSKHLVSMVLSAEAWRSRSVVAWTHFTTIPRVYCTMCSCHSHACIASIFVNCSSIAGQETLIWHDNVRFQCGCGTVFVIFVLDYYLSALFLFPLCLHPQHSYLSYSITPHLYIPLPPSHILCYPYFPTPTYFIAPPLFFTPVKRTSNQKAVPRHSPDPTATVQGPPKTDDGYFTKGASAWRPSSDQGGADEEDCHACYAVWEDYYWHGTAANGTCTCPLWPAVVECGCHGNSNG